MKRGHLKLYTLLTFSWLLSSQPTLLAQKLDIKGYNYTSKKNVELLSKDRNQVVVFLSAKCPCSDSHIDHLNQLASNFSETEFVGIHSNINEDMELGNSYFSKQRLSFPVIRDTQAEIANAYGALKTPHVFVISPKRKIIYSGPVSDSREFKTSHRKYLKEFLLSMKSGENFKPIKKRPLGCFIVR